MFLKSLTLKGFKSFAEATTLEFERGVTAVVGPNGSGKSNVVDAVAWVLGAQGPRTVRSSKMDDVIFAGSAKRPALGRAEVSLTIDNSAGLLPIDFTEVTVTRTLFRSGDSEYAINAVPCRLLDVQELLSDSGVGRHQHVIVGQGQLAAVLDARPEDRRAIIEEAAGVLKYRRRREKAQRRLAGTEASIDRLQDLVREVRRQLRPLERQAEAARRHGELAGELRALRLHLAGRELVALRSRAAAAAAAMVDLGAQVAARAGELEQLDAQIAGAESTTSDSDGDDLGGVVLQAEALRERSRGLAAVLAERKRSLGRELQATLDEALVASLEADAARLDDELAAVERAAGDLVHEAETVAAAEAALAADVARFEEEIGRHGVADGARAAEVRGELTAVRRSVEAGRAELEETSRRAAARRAEARELEERAAGQRAVVSEAAAREEALAPALAEAEAARVIAEAELEAARAHLAQAVDAERRWSARAEALALALDEARTRAGAERMAGIDGVLGTLLEVVEVDDGWQAAFEAAAGEAIAAVVVEGTDAARRALAALKTGGNDAVPGAVVVAGMAASPASLALHAAASGAEPVRAHVRGRGAGVAGVDALLDALLGDAVAVEGGWEAAVDLAVASPGLVVVTRDGDRFSPSAWRAGASSTGATGAALEVARAEQAGAQELVGAAEAAVAAAGIRLAEARQAEAAVAGDVDANDAVLGAASAELERLESERHQTDREATRLEVHAGELGVRVSAEEARQAELDAILPSLLAEEEHAAQRARAEREARAAFDERRAAVRALRNDLEVRAGAIEERRSVLAARRGEVEERLARHGGARADAARQREGIEARVQATARLAALVASRATSVERVVAAVRGERARRQEAARTAAHHLDALRRRRRDAEHELAALRERAHRLELEVAEARLREETAVEALRTGLDCEPEAAVAVACPELPAGSSAPSRLRELERELRLLGPVNALAVEELATLEERHRFLNDQLDDVRAARRDLQRVIRAVDAEIMDVFADAYADVARNFEELFATLFPGGVGRLSLTDADNLLETGVEVEARPSGKNVRKLSLLSGGERSLAALAFLFAVFRSRPSPFYLLDEVEAALDDVNLCRFLELLDEFRSTAQLLIVTHQKRTMDAADCLYGVSMQPGGSSKVVSERIAAGAG